MASLKSGSARAYTFIAVATVALAAGCASTSTRESTGEYINDAAITTRVKAAILNDASLKSAEINVETYKGRVQLSGFVSSRAAIDEAVAVTSKISGVTAVNNDMRIK